jgi:chemotaxis signal transduction protein
VQQQHDEVRSGGGIRFGVRVGACHLLIAPQTLSEVVAHPALYPLPHTPRWFLGILNQRGNLLPVFDLHQVLQMDAQEDGQRTALILDQGSDAVGLCIDGMPQSVRLEQHLRQVPPVPPLLATHVEAAYRAGKTTWLDFDHRGFFTMLGAQMTATPGSQVHG